MEIYTYRTTADDVFRTDPGCKGAGGFHPSQINTYQISARDCTKLKDTSAKATFNLATNWRASFTYFRGDKQKSGRGAGATRPAPTTWNQAGPTNMYKGEVNYTMSSSTFLTARYAYTGGGFSLEPIGGRTTQTTFDDNGVYGGSYVFYVTDRPQNNFQIEGNHFRGKHELKFGFGYRKASVASQSGWPGGVLSIYDGYPDILVQFTRDQNLKVNGKYTSAFLGDQISMNRLTINAGLRWDHQASSIEASHLDAIAFPFAPVQAMLGALDGPAMSNVVVWNSVTPRVGVTYALNESRKTILRGSYAMFASQLNATQGNIASQLPATSTGSGYVYWLGRDLNGDKQIQPNELIGSTPVDTVGFDPTNPLGGNADKVGGYKVPMTHELLGGIEHELYKNIGLSANVTWRNITNQNWTQYPGLNGADYTQTGSFTGTAPAVGNFNTPLYSVNASAVPADRGRVYEVRRRVQPALLGHRSRRHEAHGQPLDGARRILDQRAPRVLQRGGGARRSDADAATGGRAAQRAEQGRRSRRHADVGQRQGQHLPRVAQVPVHPDGRLSGQVGHQPRLELGDAAGLRTAVLPQPGAGQHGHPQRQRQERAHGRRRGELPAADGELGGLPHQQADPLPAVQLQRRL